MIIATENKYREQVLILRRVRYDVNSDDVAYYLFEEAKTENQKIVRQYCRTPIKLIYTTRGIPGIDLFLAKHLRVNHGIKNPLDFVRMLRFKTRKFPRLPVHVCASIVANFLDDVWFNNGRCSTTRKTAASISIAMSDFMLRKIPLRFL